MEMDRRKNDHSRLDWDISPSEGYSKKGSVRLIKLNCL